MSRRRVVLPRVRRQRTSVTGGRTPARGQGSWRRDQGRMSRWRRYTIVSLRHMVTTFRTFLCLLTLAALSCGRSEVASERTPAAAPVRPAASEAPKAAGVPRIVFLGDSLTAGYGLAKEES